MSSFKKATKEQAKLRLALQGPSGSGKTYTALAIATHLGSRVAVIDTENRSASKYADEFSFEVCEVHGDFHPDKFVERLHEAEAAGYDVVVADSITHFWNGTNGFLELVDAEVKRMSATGKYRGSSFDAWKTVTPIYNRLVRSIVESSVHIIATVRAKQDYEKVKNEQGKVEIKKLGMAPEMRDNFQYEMDVEGMLDMEHNFVVGKTRCRAIDGKVYSRPGKELALALKSWLESGVPASTPSDDLDSRLKAAGYRADDLIRVMIGRKAIAESVKTLAEIKPATIEQILSKWDYTLAQLAQSKPA